jgi:hypothetical protein
VRVPCSPNFAAKREIYPTTPPDAFQARDDSTGHFGAVFLGDAVTHGCAWDRSVGVQVEGFVEEFESVLGTTGVGTLIQGDGAGEVFFADIAPM